jgi:hypothetical protein
MLVLYDLLEGTNLKTEEIGLRNFVSVLVFNGLKR